MSRPETLAYLATPYSLYPGGLWAAFFAAAQLAGNLLRAGIKVYSPITHSHPIAIHAGLDPLDHDLWLDFDRMMMERCDVLIVAHLEGWEQSKGIALEVEAFTATGKRIYDCNPVTLRMDLRKGGDI
jgi:hypothetical protein